MRKAKSTSQIFDKLPPSNLNVYLETFADPNGLSMVRDPCDYLKIQKSDGSFGPWDQAASACGNYELLISEEKGPMSGTLFPNPTLLSNALGEEINGSVLMEKNGSQVLRHYAVGKTQGEPSENTAMHYINNMKKTIRRRRLGRVEDAPYPMTFSPSSGGGKECTVQSIPHWESILKLKLSANFENGKFASTYEYPWSLGEIKRPDGPDAMVCIPYHKADQTHVSAYERILSTLGCRASNRSDLDRFADVIQAWAPDLYGTEEEKTAIENGETTIEDVKNAFEGKRSVIISVFESATGKPTSAQLTCTLTHAIKGEERKVSMLRKPEKLDASVGMSSRGS